jgi:TM2 domain-containing membrane protein YozV
MFEVPRDATPIADDPPLAAAAGAPGHKFCSTCGASIHALAEICPHCGVRQAPPFPAGAPFSPVVSNRLAAGICGILVGWLGVHKFILGYTNEGVIMLVASLVGVALCGIPTLVMTVIGIVEGVIYLTKTDEDFNRIYQVGRKGWF